MKFTDVDEAIALANDSPYGLSASVWTRDIGRGKEIAQRLEVGGVNINDVYTESVLLPLAPWRLEEFRSRITARRRRGYSKVLP
jgi:acyl-CoA reductase-like NAD-dependent aldehyde dehydrogenase